MLHILEWKLLYFYSNFSEVASESSLAKVIVMHQTGNKPLPPGHYPNNDDPDITNDKSDVHAKGQGHRGHDPI